MHAPMDDPDFYTVVLSVDHNVVSVHYGESEGTANEKIDRHLAETWDWDNTQRNLHEQEKAAAMWAALPP